MGVARLIRGEVLSLREREFVQAARVMGMPTRRILVKELLPNLAAPIVVAISLMLPAFVAAEAGLAYLGIGVTSGISWGQTINKATPFFETYPLYLWEPMIGIVAWSSPSTSWATPSATRSTPRPVAERRPHTSPPILLGGANSERKAGLMRRSKPLAVVAGAALFALAACGGGRQRAASERRAEQDLSGTRRAWHGKDAEPCGLRPPTSRAPRPGGTITVYLPGDPGPDSMDPTDGWSVTGNSIQQALTNRSLTQYARDPKTGEMVLVPDLATDLGTPNADFTEWTFTIRDDAKWEDGSPVTAEEVAWGIQRSMDSDTFPAGPGTEYSQTYFSGAGEYKGPYTDKGKKWDGVTVDGQDITIKMAKPFPDMDYWGAFMAMGPVPLGKASTPPDYGKHIMSNGPYKVESFRPQEELVLVKNDQWDPNTDPARHQYADKWIFKFNQDQAKVDQIMLSDNTESQTALSTALGSNNYDRANTELGDRLVQQSSQCTSFLAPDYTKITDINVRKAIAYAYPYQDMWLATGEVPGVTRVPANSMMPPGHGGQARLLRRR